MHPVEHFDQQFDVMRWFESEVFPDAGGLEGRTGHAGEVVGIHSCMIRVVRSAAICSSGSSESGVSAVRAAMRKRPGSVIRYPESNEPAHVDVRVIIMTFMSLIYLLIADMRVIY